MLLEMSSFQTYEWEEKNMTWNGTKWEKNGANDVQFKWKSKFEKPKLENVLAE